MASVSNYTEKQVRDLIKTSESGLPYPDSTTQSTRNQTVDHTGPDIHYIEGHFYAFSGVVACSNTETTLIEAVSSSEVIKARLYFGTGSVSGRDMKWTVYLNNFVVYSYVTAGTNDAGANAQNHIEMVIPPYSQLKITSENESDSNSENQSVVIVGEVI